MNADLLQDFFQHHNLYDRSVLGFYEYAKSWKLDYPDDYFKVFGSTDINELNPMLEKVSLVINYRFDKPIEYVQVLLDIYDKEDIKVTYSFLVTLEGADLDDSIV